MEFDFDQPCSVLRYPFKADFRLEIHGSAIDAPWLHVYSSLCPAEPLPGKSLPTTVSFDDFDAVIHSVSILQTIHAQFLCFRITGYHVDIRSREP